MFKDILGDAFPIIEKFAPFISSYLGSPVAGLATTIAINVLAKAFGVNSQDVKKLGEVIVGNPNADKTLIDLNEKFSDWFKIYNLSADMDIKVHWDNKEDSK